jgi:hypothetical protein
MVGRCCRLAGWHRSPSFRVLVSPPADLEDLLLKNFYYKSLPSPARRAVTGSASPYVDQLLYTHGKVGPQNLVGDPTDGTVKPVRYRQETSNQGSSLPRLRHGCCMKAHRPAQGSGRAEGGSTSEGPDLQVLVRQHRSNNALAPKPAGLIPAVVLLIGLANPAALSIAVEPQPALTRAAAALILATGRRPGRVWRAR